MARKTKKAVLAVAQDAAAPFLFDESNLPLRLDVVKAIKDGAHKHTGERLLDNHSMVLRMVELLTAGWGLKRIAKEMSVSKHSVRAAREALVARGEMDPFKKRVVERIEDVMEQGLANYLDALEKNLVPPAQIPVGFGIMSDKRALALGEPTTIAVAAGPEDLSVEKLNAWFEGLKRAKAGPPANPSGGLPAITEGNGAIPSLDTPLDAPVPCPAGPAGAGPAEGGGGSEPGGGRERRSEGPTELEPKGGSANGA